MRRVFALAVFLLFFSLNFFLPVYAATYRDDMESITATKYRSCTNLINFSVAGGAGDNSCLAVANPNMPIGSVTYKASGAQSVNVCYYLSTGTTVFRSRDGDYILSDSYGGADGLYPTQITPKFSRGNNRVYISVDENHYYLTYDNIKGYIFKQVETLPGDLVNYGVTVYYSTNETDFKPASIRKTASQPHPNAGFYSESVTAIIPAESKLITIEINDISGIESFSGNQHYTKDIETMPKLASAEIAGEELIMGEKEKIIPKEELKEPPKETKEEEKRETKPQKSTNKKIKPDTPKEETSKAAMPEKENKTSSENFIGGAKLSEKTSSGPSKRTKSKAETSKPKEPVKAQETPQPTQEIYYTEPAAPEKDNFSRWVNLYIIAVSLGIAFVLIRPKSQ